MTAINLDRDNVLAALNEAVKEKGEDYIYVNQDGISSLNDDGFHSGAECQYVHVTDDGYEPGCIVGNVLHRLGVGIHDLRKYEAKSAYQIVNELAADGIITSDNSARALLINVQNKQDYGISWGESVKFAVENTNV